MKLEEFKNIINGHEASFSILLPSLENKYKFTYCNIKQLKMLAKASFAESNEENIDFEMYKLATFDDTCIDDLDIEDINIFDFLNLITYFRENNFSESMEFKITCAQCSKSFNYKIDFLKLVNEIEKLKFDIIYKTYTIEENEIQIGYKECNIVDYFAFEKLKLKGSDDDIMSYYPIVFMDSISINNDNIDDWNKLKFEDKLQYIEKLNIKGDIFRQIIKDGLDLFPKNRIYDIFKYSTNCPHCKNEIKNILNFDDFFLI